MYAQQRRPINMASLFPWLQGCRARYRPPGDSGAGPAVCASAARAPKRIPWRAGRHGSRTVAVAIAAVAESIRSSQAGLSSRQKNILLMTLATSGTAFFCGAFRSLTRLR